ncbi:MAG TPA: GntR family transcriptional regulator [Hyphomicrobiaceae bacterium]|nr:GntR family transcriptional regulator [Hyphomicrobiaceae bacterium]
MASNSKPATMGLSTKPLYVQVRDALTERIATGAWKPGVAILNEADLARELGVSPGTMRKALDIMEHERLVTRRQGRGTFVNDQSSDELSQRFINVRGPDGERIVGDVKSVEITEGVANEMECMRLRLRTGDRVYRFRRVRFVDEQPFMLVEASVPASLFPGLEKMNDEGRIVGLAKRFGMLLGKAEERISISTASASIAEALSVAPGSPIAVLDRVVEAIDGQPVEWRMAWCQLAENYYLAVMN